jgi:hypothetical protein
MKRQLFAVLFLLALSSLAVGQASLPVPNIVDHQTTSNFNGLSFQFTENIASAYNILVLVVDCDLTNAGAGAYANGCGATTYPSDGNGNTFVPIEHHGSSADNWAENEYYAIIPQTGSDVITFVPLYYCSPACTYKAMIEQVQGIGADN